VKLHNIIERPLFIRTQYGDDSIALVQWVFEAGLFAEVVYVDTGWAAVSWQERIQRGEQHAKDCGFQTQRLVSKITFADAVIGRQAFPSAKFQWCAGLLKGLPFLDWLETVDVQGSAVILLAKRKAAAIAHAKLSEWIDPCQYHGDRTVWHPLIEVNDTERDALLQRAGFSPLRHRSLECEPCPNSTATDWKRMCIEDRERLLSLEQESSIRWDHDSEQEDPNQYLDLFYRGCGNQFGCGL
jgi:hypothetical protein